MANSPGRICPALGVLSAPFALGEVGSKTETDCDRRSAGLDRFVSIYIARNLCASMPQVACTLALNPLIRAILADFADRGIKVPETEADRRLVLVDQFLMVPRRESFLPVSEDALLRPLISALQAIPLAEWARCLKATERPCSGAFTPSSTRRSTNGGKD
ncbi:hypothetical protein [Neorhizobium sp. DT-125]|uniref:hypothetical protein n=1 Tax=Neorhizobium sp. DT-125 TaxID=3396163 RepID=UPI003F1E38B7